MKVKPAYELKHVVTLQETNALGNVYFSNHIRWQGECRERFIHQHAPALIDQMNSGLCLVTTRCSIDYYAELMPFDEVLIRMNAGEVELNRMNLIFEYWRLEGNSRKSLVARGEQQVAWLQREGDRMVPYPVPVELLAGIDRAMADYTFDLAARQPPSM